MKKILVLIALAVVILAMPRKAENQTRDPKEIIVAEITMYTASEDETDDRPWEMASGKTVYLGAIACPGRYEFGTQVMVAGKTYICEDRMNKRYRDGNYFDIYVETKGDAYLFGRRKLIVYIYE